MTDTDLTRSKVAAGLPAGSVDESRGPHPHAAARLVPNTEEGDDA